MKKHIILSSLFVILSSTAVLAEDYNGFLTADSAPDSLQILPPPPLESSIAFLNDKAIYEVGQILKNLDRRELAAKDSDYKNISAAFSGSFGEDISLKNAPALYKLLLRVLQDSHDYAMRGAKKHYMRVRPFVFYKDSTCTPELDNQMRHTGSYPSGHASFGWAAALILAEINPARETEILKRGYDFGQSRVVCGAHWQSDVDNGRIMGAAVVSALHSNKDFIDELNSAKDEFRKNKAASRYQ